MQILTFKICVRRNEGLRKHSVLDPISRLDDCAPSSFSLSKKSFMPSLDPSHPFLACPQKFHFKWVLACVKDKREWLGGFNHSLDFKNQVSLLSLSNAPSHVFNMQKDSCFTCAHFYFSKKYSTNKREGMESR